MAYTPCYPTKRNWANLPSESSPINETNLNAMDNAIYTNDGRIVDLSIRLDTDETTLADKVDKVTGKGLSQVDNVSFTTHTSNGTKVATVNKSYVDGTSTVSEIYNGVVVDSALSSSSENPVQNKVVKSAIDAKSTVAISDTLADGDTIANVTIDGVTTPIKASQPKSEEMNVRSAMMLLTPPISNNAPYVKRVAGGGIVNPYLCDLKKIVGASIVWNQLVKNGNFADGTTDWSSNNATISVSNNILSFVGSSNGAVLTQTRSGFYLSEGHKYLKIGQFKLSGTPSGRIWYRTRRSNQLYSDTYLDTTTTNWQEVSAVFECVERVSYLINVRDNSASDWVTVQMTNLVMFDLTAMFGTAIADYVFSLDSETAGSGLAWLRKYGFFLEKYYAYTSNNKIESVSVSGKKNVGKNLYNKSRTFPYFYGYINVNTGEIISNANHYITYIEALPNQNYTVSRPRFNVNERLALGFSNELPKNGLIVNNLVSANSSGTVGEMMSLTSNSGNYRYLIVWAGWSTSGAENDNNSLQIELGSSGSAYEPYTETIYPLYHTELRGLFKLDANNNLYADGDVYNADGSSDKVFKEVDLGDLDWTYQSANERFYAIISDIQNPATNNNIVDAICEGYTANSFSNYGDKQFAKGSTGTNFFIKDSAYTDAQTFTTAVTGKKLTYKLATPTTASLTPYQSLQNVENGGTEEFIDYGVEQGTRDVAIPAGNESDYRQGISIPNLPTSGNKVELTYNPANGQFTWE